MKKRKLIIAITLLLIIFSAFIYTVFAHKGRTDANGGHRDTDNQSGLGGYHYHCGGYPAHLHQNGYCPYTSGGSYTDSSYNDENLIDYEDSYDYGYEKGYENGYEEGYVNGQLKGYDEGYDEGYDKGFEDGYKDRIEEAAIEKEKGNKLLLFTTFGIIVIILLVRFLIKRREK